MSAANEVAILEEIMGELIIGFQPCELITIDQDNPLAQVF